MWFEVSKINFLKKTRVCVFYAWIEKFQKGKVFAIFLKISLFKDFAQTNASMLNFFFEKICFGEGFSSEMCL